METSAQPGRGAKRPREGKPSSSTGHSKRSKGRGPMQNLKNLLRKAITIYVPPIQKNKNNLGPYCTFLATNYLKNILGLAVLTQDLKPGKVANVWDPADGVHEVNATIALQLIFPGAPPLQHHHLTDEAAGFDYLASILNWERAQQLGAEGHQALPPITGPMAALCFVKVAGMAYSFTDIWGVWPADVSRFRAVPDTQLPPAWLAMRATYVARAKLRRDRKAAVRRGPAQRQASEEDEEEVEEEDEMQEEVEAVAAQAQTVPSAAVAVAVASPAPPALAVPSPPLSTPHAVPFFHGPVPAGCTSTSPCPSPTSVSPFMGEAAVVDEEDCVLGDFGRCSSPIPTTAPAPSPAAAPGASPFATFACPRLSPADFPCAGARPFPQQDANANARTCSLHTPTTSLSFLSLEGMEDVGLRQLLGEHTCSDVEEGEAVSGVTSAGSGVSEDEVSPLFPSALQPQLQQLAPAACPPPALLPPMQLPAAPPLSFTRVVTTGMPAPAPTQHYEEALTTAQEVMELLGMGMDWGQA